MPYRLSILVGLFLLLIPGVGQAQQSREASFLFNDDGGMLKLTIVVEKANLVNAINLEEGCDPSKSLGICANWYVGNHLRCAINTHTVPLSFTGSSYQEDYIHLDFQINFFTQDVRSITVKTDCFLALHPDFVNSVRFLFTDYERSYNMDAKRQEVMARF